MNTVDRSNGALLGVCACCGCAPGEYLDADELPICRSCLDSVEDIYEEDEQDLSRNWEDSSYG